MGSSNDENGCLVALCVAFGVAFVIFVASQSSSSSRGSYYNSTPTPVQTLPSSREPLVPNYNWIFQNPQPLIIERESTPDDAYSEGYEEGYAQGLDDGRNGRSHGYGYDDSCSYYDYYETRYEEGYEEGYDDGYSKGEEEYEEEYEEEEEW